MKWTALFTSLALAAIARPAGAQQCPASSVGQPCTSTATFAGWWGTGLCVASMCSNTAPDGATAESPCGFCEPVACPSTEIGQPCEAGACTQARCLVTDDAGSGSWQPCGVCASPPPDGCATGDVGRPCAGGGLCTMTGTRSYGPAGAPPPSQVTYPVARCEVTPDAGGDEDAALSHGDGAGVQTSGGASGPGGSHGPGSSGCAVTTARDAAGPRATVLAAAALAFLAYRRKRRSRPQRTRAQSDGFHYPVTDPTDEGHP